MDLMTWLRAEWDRVLGFTLIALGAVLLVLGYLGVSDSPYVAEQLSYIVSGGLGGLFLPYLIGQLLDNSSSAMPIVVFCGAVLASSWVAVVRLVLKQDGAQIKALPSSQTGPLSLQTMGDMSDTGGMANLTYMKSLLDSTGLAYHEGVGNHEITQGADPENELAGDAERFLAGGQHAEVATAEEQPFDEARRREKDVLAIVQDEKSALAAELGGNRDGDIATGVDQKAKGARDGVGDPGRVGHRGQLAKPGATWVELG